MKIIDLILSHSSLIIRPTALPQILVEVQSNLSNASETILPRINNFLTLLWVCLPITLINERNIVILFSAHVHCQHTFYVLRTRTNLSAHNFIHHRSVLHFKLLWTSLRGVNSKNLSVIVNWIPHDRFVAKIIDIIHYFLRPVQAWDKWNNQKWKVD